MNDANQYKEKKQSSIIGRLFGDSFFIELFGIFLPGVVAVGFTALMGGLIVWCILDKPSIVNLCVTCGTSVYSLVWLFFIALSYSVGAVIYRRGPKHPDYIAAYNQWKRSKGEEVKKRLAFEFIKKERSEKMWERIKLKCRKLFVKYEWVRRRSEFNPDFPYPFLRRYLVKRGFDHLVNYVAWCDGYKIGGRGDVDKGFRSKQAINIIKHRLNAIGASRICDDISKNESHIRLISSLWYVMRYIKYSSAISLIFIMMWFYFKIKINNGSLCLFIALTISLSVVFCLAWRIKKDVETSIHYVRIRELISILEGAWVYDNKLRSEGTKPLFDDLEKEGALFGSEHCINCEGCDKNLKARIVNVKESV